VGTAQGRPPELTARALVSGALIGTVLAVSNVYMGLKLSFWESGCIVAALLAYSGMSAVSARGGGVAPSALETNIAQTLAASMGAMPAAAGVLGAIPALVLLKLDVPGWVVALWGVGLGTLGVLVAYSLRRRLQEEERLPFATGTATAELTTTLHAEGAVQPARTRGLLGSGLAGMAVALLRDGLKVLPGFLPFPGHLRGLPAGELGWGVGLNPMLLGVGMLLGPQMGLSLLLGAVVAWGVLGPGLVHGQAVKPEALPGWLTWPGVGLMVGASVSSLVALGRLLPSAARDLLRLGRRGPDSRESGAPVGWVALAAMLLVLAVGSLFLGLHPLHVLLTLVLVFPLCAVGGRAAGQTDISPVSPMGQLQQMAFGAVAPGQVGLNVAAGSVSAGAMAHTGVGLWSLQAGRLLGATPSRQLTVQLVGVLLGAAVAVPTYALLVAVYQVGPGTQLPAPMASQFKAMAEVTATGVKGLPEGAALAGGLGLLVGLVLSVAARGRLARLLPSAAAMGIAFFVPPVVSLTICLGAFLAVGMRRVWPASAPVTPSAATGAIAGESLMSVLIALLIWLGLFTPPA
jgi:putative OPT family oligopeptide transporter